MGNNIEIRGPDREAFEVTPEMAAAGALALARFTTMFEDLEEGATRIFLEMLSASPEKLAYELDAFHLSRPRNPL